MGRAEDRADEWMGKLYCSPPAARFWRENASDLESPSAWITWAL